ncbi:hypothetical protein NtRootA1_18620 [Arthrobacter sp. NtRootA1]|nr:hypothetical protein NtRootA1_18620 [Arthrobacter sp. NtRootA1]
MAAQHLSDWGLSQCITQSGAHASRDVSNTATPVVSWSSRRRRGIRGDRQSTLAPDGRGSTGGAYVQGQKGLASLYSARGKFRLDNNE